MTKLIVLLCWIVSAFLPCVARGQEFSRIIAVSTNIPYDICFVPGYGLTSIPSFSLEYYPADKQRWSLGLDAEFPWWKHPEEHRYLQINALTLSGRWYFLKNYRGDYKGLYALASAEAGRYGIGFDAKGWEGEALGASAGLGFKHRIGKPASPFFFDCGVSLGYIYLRYDPYIWGDDSTRHYYYDWSGLPEDFVKRNKGRDWWGPTRIWLSVGIELFKRKTER